MMRIPRGARVLVAVTLLSVCGAGATAACGSDGTTATADAGAEGSIPNNAPDAGSGSTDAADAAVYTPVEITVSSLIGVPTLGDPHANQTWAAWRDGEGQWQPLLPSSTGIYKFTATKGSYGAAFECYAPGSGYTSLNVYLRTSATTAFTVPGNVCGDPVGKSQGLYGQMTNAPDGSTGWDTRSLYAGNTGQIVNGSAMYIGQSGNSHYLPGRAYDIGFSAGTVIGPSRITFARGLLFGDAGTLTHDIDWATEGFAATQQYTASITGVSGFAYMHVGYGVGGLDDIGGANSLSLMAGKLAQDGGTMSAPYAAVTAGQAASDVYVFLATGDNGGSSATSTVTRLFKTAADVSVSLSPPFLPTISAAPGSASLRTQATFAPYPKAQTYEVFNSGNGYVYMLVDASLVGTKGPLTIAIPDLSGVAGWDDKWLPSVNADAGSISASARAGYTETYADGTALYQSLFISALP